LGQDSERTVERFLVDSIASLGGWCPKWGGVGERGVPDRICLLPDGRVFFVEVKRKGGRLSPSQKLVHKRMMALGAKVYTLWSKDEVRAFVDAIQSDPDF